MSIREEDDASISAGEIGADVSSEVYDGEEEEDEFDEIDFKKSKPCLIWYWMSYTFI